MHSTSLSSVKKCSSNYRPIIRSTTEGPNEFKAIKCSETRSNHLFCVWGNYLSNKAAFLLLSFSIFTPLFLAWISNDVHRLTLPTFEPIKAVLFGVRVRRKSSRSPGLWIIWNGPSLHFSCNMISFVFERWRFWAALFYPELINKTGAACDCLKIPLY